MLKKRINQRLHILYICIIHGRMSSSSFRPLPIGRGAAANPANRFHAMHVDDDPDYRSEPSPEEDSARPRLVTTFSEDQSESFLTYNKSPDIGFNVGANPYRGCEHGCAYCYARPSHEFLGYSAGLDFESRIITKPRAAQILRRELSAQRWKPQVIGMSGITDCYQPAERRFRLTRRVLEVLAECRNPVGIITKNYLVTRDMDVLRELAAHQAVSVTLSITSLDANLARRLEPRASTPAFRLRAVRKLAAAGVLVTVNIAPVIPGLNDSEVPHLVAAAAQAGAARTSYQLLRLPLAVKDIFTDWLERHVPARKQRVLEAIKSMRGGKLHEPRFGHRMRGEGTLAHNVATMHQVASRRANFREAPYELTTAHFRRPQGDQLMLL